MATGGTSWDKQTEKNADADKLVRENRAKADRYEREKETPVTNLFLDMLDKLGVPLNEFGDSTYNLNVLSG